MAEPGAAPRPNPRLQAWLGIPLSTGPSVAWDSETVVYLSNEGGFYQPWAIPRRGGPARRIHVGAERTQRLLANPRAPVALLVGDAGGNERSQFELLPLEGRDRAARPVTSEPEVIHSLGAWDSEGRWLYYTSNRRDRRFFDVYRRDPGREGSEEMVRHEDAHLTVHDVRDDRLLVERSNTNLDGDLFLSVGGDWRHLNPHEGEETVLAAAIGEDAVYAAANPSREFCALVRYRTSGGGAEFLKEYPGDVELLKVSPDGRGILLAINRAGMSETHLYDPSTGEDRPLLSGPKGVIQTIAWCPDGAGFAYDVSYSEGQDIYYRAIETGKERRLTRPTMSLPVPPVEPRSGRIRASDGVTIPYWEYVSRASPVRGTIVQVHGGPESQARPGFLPIVQFLVSEGWRVLLPNVRGSTGYGRTFVHLDDVRRRMDSVRDLKEVVEAAVREGRAERGRIGVIGGSYGGFMVLSALTTYPDLFAVGVEVVGIANFLTFLEKTAPWRRPLRESEYGSLEHDREFLRSISPVFHADRITAPLLVVHGRNDPRVPFEEAEQIVETLQKLGRRVELMEYAQEGHGMHRRDDQLEAYT
ncbi:MAG: alpha/beta fold hydrolase, partial [Thermoplasmata archaeon]